MPGPIPMREGRLQEIEQIKRRMALEKALAEQYGRSMHPAMAGAKMGMQGAAAGAGIGGAIGAARGMADDVARLHVPTKTEYGGPGWLDMFRSNPSPPFPSSHPEQFRFYRPDERALKGGGPSAAIGAGVGAVAGAGLGLARAAEVMKDPRWAEIRRMVESGASDQEIEEALGLGGEFGAAGSAY